LSHVVGAGAAVVAAVDRTEVPNIRHAGIFVDQTVQ
jgi:hypothetical protein